MYEDFQIIVSSMGDLPQSPTVAAKLLKLLEDTKMSVRDLARLVSIDQAISAKILMMANSALFHQQGQVTTLERAIVVIGEDLLKKTVMDFSLRNANKSYGLIERWLWENSVGCAVAARMIAESCENATPDEAFSAGLFHNIGKIVMRNRDRTLYRQVMEIAERGEASLQDVERALFAYSHEMVGAALLHHWNFPPLLVEAVRHHHDFEACRENEPEIYALAATISLGGDFCRFFGVGPKQERKEIDLTGTAGGRALEMTEERLKPLLENFLPSFLEERNRLLS